MNKKHKFLYGISIVTLLMTLGFIGQLAYWVLWPIKVITIDNPTAIPVDKAVYHPGERLSYTLKSCKYTNVQAVVMRRLVNDISLNFTSYATTLPMGCKTSTIKDLIIPDFADNGTYHIEATAVYQINPLRTFQDSWRSVDFKIEK